MLKNTITLIALLLQVSLLAQNTLKEKVVLTNGEIYEGIVVEQVPGEYIQLYRTLEKDTLKIEMVDIERMIRQIEPEAPSSTKKEKEKDANAWIWGQQRYNTKSTYIMIHGATGAGDYAHSGLGLSLGYNFYDWQFGGGVQYFGNTGTVNNGNWSTIPISLDARFMFSQSKKGMFATFLCMSGGYNVVLSNEVAASVFGEPGRTENGLYLFPSLAFRFNLAKNLGLMLDIGYHMNTGKIYGLNTDDFLGTIRHDNILFRGSLFF